MPSPVRPSRLATSSATCARTARSSSSKCCVRRRETTRANCSTSSSPSATSPKKRPCRPRSLTSRFTTLSPGSPIAPSSWTGSPKAMARAVRKGGIGAVLLLDLDNFQGVNDTYGHVVGDQLLVAIAHRLDLVARTSDSLARSGDDEFLYLAEGMNSPRRRGDRRQAPAGCLQRALPHRRHRPRPARQHGRDGLGRVATPIAPRSSRTPTSRSSRPSARARTVTSPSRPTCTSRRWTALSWSRTCVEVSYRTSSRCTTSPSSTWPPPTVVGFEALMRWQHPVRGMVPPGGLHSPGRAERPHSRTRDVRAPERD